MKLGFIGGRGHHYLRGLVRDGTVTEFAVASDGHDPEAARQAAKLPGKGQWFDDPRQMLDVFKPDIVSVGAVYGFNGDLAAMVLERNLPVVSDKPVAATWTQLDRLRELTRDPSRVLLTEFDFRSRQDFRAAREAVSAGLIGDVILVTAQKSYRFGDSRPQWYRDRTSYGGTVLWIASHAIDLITFVTGKKIERAVGHQGNLSQPSYGSMEDHLAILCALNGGATAVVHADYLRPTAASTHGDDRIRVAGSKGVLEVRDMKCILITNDQAETDITARAVVEPIHVELLAAIRGERADLYSTALSLERAEVLLKLRDAADRREWVKAK